MLRLLAAAKGKRHRDWLLILTAFQHGLRATEVIRLRPEDLADGFLDCRRLKGSLHTIQPLVEHSEPLLDEKFALLDYARKSIPGRPLFPITRQRFWQIVQEYGKLAGLPRHRTFPHVLKHTCAMLSIELAGVENVRQYLGHKSLSSTGAYLKVSDEAASAAHKKATEF